MDHGWWVILSSEMKKSVCSLLVAAASAGVAWAAPVSGEGERFPEGYVPPLLANGDLSLTFNESRIHAHPWFATASGCVVEALNTMLLASCGDEIRVGCAVPASWKDYAFRLPAYGGVTVDCEVKDGTVARLEVRSRTDAARTVRLVLPDGSRREVLARAR